MVLGGLQKPLKNLFYIGPKSTTFVVEIPTRMKKVTLYRNEGVKESD